MALYSKLSLNVPFDAAVWALASAALWGCRRLGELTIPSIQGFDPLRHVARSAEIKRVKHGNSYTSSFHIPWTKSTQERGGTVILTDREDELCPAVALQNHLTPGGRWLPMTKDWFLTRCTDIWKSCGLLAVAGHSFRIGGSTELLLAGVPCEVVAATGGWSSLAFLLYWRKLEHIIAMAIGKAYDKKKIEEVALVFERFRVDNNIQLAHDEDL
ncbi:hypothetical protein MIND_00384500 [Mycena indigotica]|uniref:Uncharacterized protein n=1 Tax=Mycena indigotica TaxID=2126181 RepID=A0A8H6WBD2_9AGAR|nr:uncharacterized protein MIND_00384500 [Mycena indigotica]KAF7310111.1 hypothetical protein MIND_00384500 [Mycena indigotica]